jgi:hypothetical protein
VFFLGFGNLFLRQELQDHTSFTLKVQQPPLGAMEEFTSGTACNALLLIKMIWWFLGSQKAKCGYSLGFNSSQIWIGVGAWKQFVQLWGANIVC